MRQISALVFLIFFPSPIASGCKQPEVIDPNVCACGAIAVYNFEETLPKLNVETEEAINQQTDAVMTVDAQCTFSIECKKNQSNPDATVALSVFDVTGKMYQSLLWVTKESARMPLQCNLKEKKWYVNGTAVKDYGCNLNLVTYEH